jgi:sugar lactone lactonase YvrE
MNRKLIVVFLIILILAVVALMVKDLYFSEISQENPYELNTDSLKKYDTSLICYKEVAQIKPEIEELNGMSIDDKDNIVIVGSKVIVYDKEFKEIKSFKLGEVGNCIAVNSNGEIYLGVQNHIEVWDVKGNFLKRWETGNTESILSGIAVNESSVFVADATDRLVHEYDLNGKFLKDFAKEDLSKGVPGIIIRSAFFDVSIGRDNEIWIVNPGAYLLEAFDKKGGLISTWGKSSEEIHGFCGCCNPTNFTLLSDGSFVTSEKAIPRVKIYSQTGEFVCIVAGPDKFDDGTKGLDLAVDSRNRIYVLDPSRKQIRIFEKSN